MRCCSLSLSLSLFLSLSGKHKPWENSFGKNFDAFQENKTFMRTYSFLDIRFDADFCLTRKMIQNSIIVLQNADSKPRMCKICQKVQIPTYPDMSKPVRNCPDMSRPVQAWPGGCPGVQDLSRGCPGRQILPERNSLLL